MKMLKHSSLDRGVVDSAKECNKAMEGEGSEAIACKIANLRALDQAFRDKKKDMRESEDRAKINQTKVQGHIKDLQKAKKLAEDKEAAEEKQHKKDVEAALKARMSEIEGCERARITADMSAKRACSQANAEAKMKEAHAQAARAKEFAR